MRNMDRQTDKTYRVVKVCDVDILNAYMDPDWNTLKSNYQH